MPADIITGALRALEKIATPVGRSRLYGSPAWPDPSDPPFVNAVAAFSAGPPPDGFLAALHAIEAGYGRRRTRRNGPRTLDLDLLDYNGLIRSPGLDGALALPHPGIAERAFVLAPLAEVAPDWRHPVLGASAAGLLARLGGPAATALEPA